MWGIIKVYRRVVTRYPIIIQATQAGILMALGDQIAQNFIERKKFKELDFLRTAQFGSIGFFITVLDHVLLVFCSLQSKISHSIDNQHRLYILGKMD